MRLTPRGLLRPWHPVVAGVGVRGAHWGFAPVQPRARSPPTLDMLAANIITLLPTNERSTIIEFVQLAQWPAIFVLVALLTDDQLSPIVLILGLVFRRDLSAVLRQR